MINRIRLLLIIFAPSMEQQFILRLPDSLLDVDPKDCSLAKINSKEVHFTVKGKNYPGIICKIPTIVESQKIVDNKLYKIADISTLIVIYENKNFNLEEEISKLESSGLTPPMAFVKERRFEKNSVKTEEVEKIESKVNELLAEDAKAIKVEIISNEKESNENDLDLLVAEIENEFKPSNVSREQKVNDKHVISPVKYTSVDTGKPSSEIKKSNVPLETNKTVLEELSTPTQQLRLETTSNSKPLSHPSIPKEKPINGTTGIAMPLYEPETVEKLKPAPENKQIPSNIDQIPENQKVKSPELLALEAKIKEKEEQFEKAANPILKKRFETALEALKEEYKNKLLKQD